MGTRNDWANVGRDFKKLGSDFGKTFIKTVKKGTHKIDDWATSDDNSNTQNTENQAPVAEATVVSVSEE